MSRNVLITGATGLIGRKLVYELSKRGDNIFALTSNINSAGKRLNGVKKIVSWNDYLSLSEENIDIIINLAGRNMGEKRWGEEFKKDGFDSRINSTRKVVELIEKMKNKPQALLNASGVDYYGNRGEENIYEDAAPADDYMAELCVAWEAEAMKAEKFEVRVVILRTGFVMAKNAPSIKKFVLPFRLFIGGTIGNGKQYMSWIHIDDAAGIYLFSADNSNVSGAVNNTAPNPVTMKNFSKSLAKALHRPAIFHVPPFAIKIALGEMSQVVLNGRKALPKKIIDAGYKFKFGNVLDAWKEVLH